MDSERAVVDPETYQWLQNSFYELQTKVRNAVPDIQPTIESANVVRIVDVNSMLASGFPEEMDAQLLNSLNSPNAEIIFSLNQFGTS